MRLVARTYFFAIFAAATATLAAIGGIVVVRAQLVPRVVELARFVAREVLVQRDAPSRLDAATERAALALDGPLAIFDAQGNLLAAARGGESYHGLDPERLGARGWRQDGETLVVAVRDSDALLGFAALGSGDEHLALAPAGLALTGVAVLAVLFIGAAWFARGIVLPLRKLEAAASAFGGGDLARRADLGRTDELGRFGAAFDDMAERIVSLMQAQRELIANVSHELRTPLARLRVLLDLAADGGALPEPATLAEIEVEARELEVLVEDVMQAARLDMLSSGAPPLRIQEVLLAEVIADAAQRCTSGAERSRIAVDMPQELTLDADPVLLRRVLTNLLDNARKYAAAGSPIRISAQRDGDQVVVVVRDEGIGIAAADRDRVFEPFFRGDASRSRATGGTGLGLTLVRRIVEAHHGTVTLESAPGEGTTVRLRLPARTAIAGRLP